MKKTTLMTVMFRLVVAVMVVGMLSAWGTVPVYAEKMAGCKVHGYSNYSDGHCNDCGDHRYKTEKRYGHSNRYDRSDRYDRYDRSDRYDAGDRYGRRYDRYDGRHGRKYHRQMIKEIRWNERRIMKLEHKIRKYERKAYYTGYYNRGYYTMQIRTLRRELRQLERRNHFLKHRLNRY